MPELGYVIAAVALSGLITLGLRALPILVVQRMRRSRFVAALGRWMPAGILLILAVVVLRDTVTEHPARWWAVAAATGVTVLVHLLGRRRAVLSIAAGTAVYILLVNAF